MFIKADKQIGAGHQRVAWFKTHAVFTVVASRRYVFMPKAGAEKRISDGRLRNNALICSFIISSQHFMASFSASFYVIKEPSDPLEVATDKIRRATSREIFRTGNLAYALRESGYFYNGNRTNCDFFVLGASNALRHLLQNRYNKSPFLHNMLEQLKNVNTVYPVFV
jgi:hypothetical protein